MKPLKQKRFKWLIIGLSLSFLGPLGEWVLLTMFAQNKGNSILLSYIYAEFAALLAFGVFGYLLGSYADRLEKLVITDKLTGLYNRHSIMDRLNEMFNMHQRYNEYFSLILLDLDHFKLVNDTYGHAVGDQTLIVVSEVISKEVRGTDHPCRFGGEEFLILCPRTNIEEAYNLAERIRMKVMNLRKKELGFSGPQTISAGVYEVVGDQNTSPTEALSKVDDALYRAKKGGRNRIVSETKSY
ncbi:MAG: GGDEF domain-containing protein [Proteobacteria bacterium]|nr:GGDEF domain-containing protein [Pseudomonadota bacterium]